MKRAIARLCRWLMPLTLLMGTAAITTGATPAHALSSGATCSGDWYIHAPYPWGSSYAGWATCVTSPNTYPYPDTGRWGQYAIEEIIIVHGHYNTFLHEWDYDNVGGNYMAGGQLDPTTDTTIATFSCVIGDTYQTVVISNNPYAPRSESYEIYPCG